MDNKLLKKLHIKPGFRLFIDNSPENVTTLLGDFDAIQLSFNRKQPFDSLLLFVKNNEELADRLKLLSPNLKEDTLFWIAYPKKSSGIESDLNMMSSWDEVKKYGLTPCASASISEIWTGLRMKPETLVKSSELRNENLKNNDFSEYINVDQKLVIPPVDLDLALHEHPKALSYFHSLAYSHKKEYVLWILTAKQSKTRISRIGKMIAMLLSEKKNPTAK